MNRSLLNESTINDDDEVDFPVSGLEPLQEEEEDDDYADILDARANQTTSGFSYHPTEGFTTSMIPSMSNLVEEDEKDELKDFPMRDEGATMTAIITEAVPSISRLLDEDEEDSLLAKSKEEEEEDAGKKNANADNRNDELDASIEQHEEGVREDEFTGGSALNVTVNNNQSIASHYTSGGTEKLNITNSIDKSIQISL